MNGFFEQFPIVFQSLNSGFLQTLKLFAVTLLGALPLKPLVLYTTRPPRENEQDGREYFFISTQQLAEMQQQGMLIESRTYHTEAGDWTYCTAKHSADLSSGSYLAIGTLESYRALRDYYGAETVIPIYIEVEDGIRLERALRREQQQSAPNYAELCRRFLADAEDHSEAHLAAAGIERRFQNESLDRCTAEITDYLRGYGVSGVA